MPNVPVAFLHYFRILSRAYRKANISAHLKIEESAFIYFAGLRQGVLRSQQSKPHRKRGLIAKPIVSARLESIVHAGESAAFPLLPLGKRLPIVLRQRLSLLPKWKKDERESSRPKWEPFKQTGAPISSKKRRRITYRYISLVRSWANKSNNSKI